MTPFRSHCSDPKISSVGTSVGGERGQYTILVEGVTDSGNVGWELLSDMSHVTVPYFTKFEYSTSVVLLETSVTVPRSDKGLSRPLKSY